MVEFGEDTVTIYDAAGYEVVHWIQDEWEDDPTVVYSIVNAVHIFHTQGVDALKALVGWRQPAYPSREVG